MRSSTRVNSRSTWSRVGRFGAVSVRSLDDPSADREQARSASLRLASDASARRGIRRPCAATRRGRRARDRSACRRRRPCRRSCRARPRAFDVEDVVDDLKREPELAAARVDAPRSARRLPPPMIAPATADARISAPVFLRVHRAQRRRRRAAGCSCPCGSGVTDARSIACPPTMPTAPAACGDGLDDAQLAGDDARIARSRARAPAR